MPQGHHTKTGAIVKGEKGAIGKALLLWLFGVPVSLILVLWLLGILK
jgi:hypothetical protein